MTKLDLILEQYPEVEFMVAEGFDEAVLGVEQESLRLIYSQAMCVQVLSRQMPYEEALEYLHFNTFHAYFGEKTPIWCDDIL